MQNAWMYSGRRHGADERLLQEVQHLRHSVPATPAPRWAAGSARRSRTLADLNGLKMRIGGFAGTRACEARRGAAADRRRRNLSGAGEGHDRRRRMGRPLRRREARLLQGRAVLLLSRLVGRRRRCSTTSSTSTSGTRCRRPTRRSCAPRPPMANEWMLSKYDARNPAALQAAASAAGAQLRPFPQAVMDACCKAANEVYAEDRRPRTPTSRRCCDAMLAFRNDAVSVVAGRRIHLRQLHDPHRARAA